MAKVFASLLFVLFGASVAQAQVVERVLDGDTIILKGGERVRFYGIDAPEKEQVWGMEAKAALEKLVLGKRVVLFRNGKDRYGRTIARVSVNHQDVGIEMVSQGHAWHYVQFSSGDRDLAQAERDARRAHKGLWGQEGPKIAPWNWRHEDK